MRPLLLFVLLVFFLGIHTAPAQELVQRVYAVLQSGQSVGKGALAKGMRQGPWTFQDRQTGRLLAELTFRDDYLHGHCRIFEADSTLVELTFQYENLHGPFALYYPSGKLQCEGQYLTELLEGPFNCYFANGRPALKGYYQDSLREGVWTSYHPLEGNLIDSGNYHMGLREGEWTYFYANGNVHYVSRYRQGRLQEIVKTLTYAGKPLINTGLAAGNGILLAYDSLGLLKARLPYKEGLVDGLAEYLSPGGKRRMEVPYVQDVPQGWRREYYPGGQRLREETLLRDGREQGPHMEYYSDGKVQLRGQYRNQSEDSVWTGYFASGKVQSLAQYRLGQPIGTWRTYHEDGTQASAVTYNTRGLRQGTYLETHDNGAPRIKSKFVKGERDSVWTEYHPNGQVSFRGLYRLGREDGLHAEYDEQGRPTRLLTYKDGGSSKESIAMVRELYPGTDMVRRQGLLHAGLPDSSWATYRPDGGPWQNELYDVPGHLFSAGVVMSEGKDLPQSAYLRPQTTDRSLYDPVDGHLAESGPYDLHGQRSGVWTEYNAKRQPILRGPYAAGLREGDWQRLDRRGRPTEQATFAEGEMTVPWVEVGK